MNTVALQTYLEPFAVYFEKPEVSEICINRPEGIWIEEKGRFHYEERPDLTLAFLWRWARLVAEHNHRDISAESPILSSVLPNKCRIQFVVEPACEKGSFVCSIRKPSITKVSLSDYFGSKNKTDSSLSDHNLLTLYREKNYPAFLQAAVLQKKNILISGGTSTGKTTFLNTLLESIPLTERLLTIETDREVLPSHPNTVHLLADQEKNSLAAITMLDLLKASLRLRPDRILVSELRGEEAFSYLRAVNSGHPGSITTLHADSVDGCFEQLALMVMQSGCQLTRSEIMMYIKSIISIVVQIKRDDIGKRFVSAVYFKEAEEGV